MAIHDVSFSMYFLALVMISQEWRAWAQVSMLFGYISSYIAVIYWNLSTDALTHLYFPLQTSLLFAPGRRSITWSWTSCPSMVSSKASFASPHPWIPGDFHALRKTPAPGHVIWVQLGLHQTCGKMKYKIWFQHRWDTSSPRLKDTFQCNNEDNFSHSSPHQSCF